MQDYINMLHEFFLERLVKFKGEKKDLGEKYSLAMDAHMWAVSDSVKRVAEDDVFRPLYENIRWYHTELSKIYRTLLEGNIKTDMFPGASQYDIARELHWQAREMVMFHVARNGGFRPPPSGRPKKLV